MDIQSQIDGYLDSLPEAKRAEMRRLHEDVLSLSPGCRTWFSDGRNEEGKVVSNPNIGYGQYTIKYANGTEKEFFRIGLSANTSGISVYVMGLADKKHLADNYASTIGKANVTGYCIKFKSLKDIHLDVLKAAIQVGFDSKG